MTPRDRRLLTALLIAVTLVAPLRVHAQGIPVYDASNWYQALLQVIQMVEQVRLLARQARRLPLDMATRYHGHSVEWTLHRLDADLRYAQELLGALNTGDLSGAAYRRLTEPLDRSTEIIEGMPANLRRRVANVYAGIELADSASALAVNHLGAMRLEGPHNLQVTRTMERDATSPDAEFHTQTAVLNKINAAAVLGLRMQDYISQALMASLEQQMVANRRQRDAEAALINATVHHWRYGRAYGADLFRHTAATLDGWRPY